MTKLQKLIKEFDIKIEKAKYGKFYYFKGKKIYQSDNKKVGMTDNEIFDESPQNLCFL
jgi:hypothetical protein